MYIACHNLSLQCAHVSCDEHKVAWPSYFIVPTPKLHDALMYRELEWLVHRILLFTLHTPRDALMYRTEKNFGDQKFCESINVEFWQKIVW